MNDGHPVSRSAAEGLVGRETEAALLASFVDEATTSGGVLLLSGDPGVGKSVLLDVAVTLASGAGALVLRSDGVEFLQGVSFSNLSNVLAPLHREIGELAPVHRQALTVALGIGDGAAVDRVVVYSAALALLRKAAGVRPLLLVVDDLQWVDRASAAAFAFIARRLAGSPVGLLAASRTGAEVSIDRTGLPESEVRPLDDTAAADLVRGRFPELGARVRQCVLDQAQGNPLALLELPTAVSGLRNGTLSTSSAVPAPSRRLLDLYGSRIDALPTTTRRLLLLAALEGTGDLRVLRAATGEDVLGDLIPAERAHLVHVDGRGPARLAFRHPLVRATIVWASSGAERIAAHSALAQALADRPDRQVWHLVEATAEPDEHVAMLLERTARQTRRRGDAVGAFNALVRAADLSPGAENRIRRLAEAACVASDSAGELQAAARLLVEARRVDPDLRGSLRAATAASNVLLNRDGDATTAFRLLIDAIAAHAGRPEPPDEEAMLGALRILLRVCLIGGRAEMWDGYHAVMAQMPVRMPRVMEVLVDVYADPARATAQSLARLDEAIRDLHLETELTRIEQVARAALYVDRATRCRAPLWRVVEDGREGGAVASAINALMVLYLDDFMTGQWDECARLIEEGLSLCDTHGYRMMARIFQSGQAMLAAVRGDDDTVRILDLQITDWTNASGFDNVKRGVAYASALAALGRGDYEEAYRKASVVSPPGVLTPHVPPALWACVDLVEAAVRTGRRTEALAHVAAMREAGLPAVSPRLALLTAGSAAMAAPEDQAAGLFEEALAIPGIERWPFAVARVRLAYGRRLRHARAVKDARFQLVAALDTFRLLGATPWAAQAAEELRANGHATSWTHHKSLTNPLTPQEHEIATLAASGMTNKQIGARLFLSHRSVAAHLHRLYPKLGVTSRVTLAEALAALPHPRASAETKAAGTVR